MSDERDDDAATPGGAFPWGLTPGGAAEAPVPPVAKPPVYEPPAQAPVYQPPVAAPPVHQPPVAQPPAYQPPPSYEAPTAAFEAFPPLDPAIEGVTEALSPHPVGLPDPVDEGLESSPIEALFGDAAFVEYEAAPIIPPPPRRQATAGPGQDLVVVPVAPRPPRAPIPRVQKILMGVAGGLVAALALIALFLLGTRLSAAFPPPAVAASASPSPSPSASGGPLAVGPVAPGPHAWHELLGGECLDPFESAWQDEYVVVPCTAAHAAQHVFRGVFDDPAGTVYPGLDELQSRINLLCTSPAIIDFAAAGTVLDLQVTASFALDAEQWDDGDRDYFCFVDRAGGEAITGSLALPPVVPATPAP